MKEITKITFYGKDFSPIDQIDKAKVKGHEREHKLEEEIGGCPGLTYHVLLERFVEKYRIPKAGKSLVFSADSTKFGKWVGVFRDKKFKEETTKKEFDITLEISCRLDTDENAYFLAAMLLCLEPEALSRKLKDLERVTITFRQVMDIFLLFLFRNQLAEAVKKGIFRKYQRFENNDSRPHGTIDIARHIRENMGLNNGTISYHYRELTADNPVNRLILAAYKRLREKFPTLCEEHISREESLYSTLKMLQTGLGYSKTNARNIVKENLRPITHPYFLEYEALRKTCLKILRDENVSIFDADDCAEETESLYEDVTRLWEKFLESRLRKKLEESKGPGLSLTAQDIKPIFAERKGKGNTSRPDFVLWLGQQRNRRAIAILDAKFKPDWNKFFCGSSSEANTAIDADRNKCFRDMVVFRALRTGVIFPFSKKEENSENDPYPETYHIGYHIIGLHAMFDMVRVRVPQEGGKSFAAWYQELEQNVDKALKDYLEKLNQKIRDPYRSLET